MRTAALHIHILLAYVIVIYGFVCLWLDSRLKKKEPINDATRLAHKQYALAVKVIQYMTIITLLTGVYLLARRFQTMEAVGISLPPLAFGWAYLKIVLFLALTGIMGAMGSIPLKKRLAGLEQGGLDTATHESTARKLQSFKLIQLSLIVIMFGLGQYKPSPVEIEVQRNPPTSEEKPTAENPGSNQEPGEAPGPSSPAGN
ncbi:MAG: hypothetical protein KDK23_06400 [Leptospiraceae bacterium]|nr:hypothetical protein [Leptospiraceae bacterium]